MKFNKYPYLNLTDLNLDYILNAIKEMRYEVTNFVSINAIKYANPIQWSIARQYEKNTIVIDPVTGTAYISVAPVPKGVALTRPEYWSVVFDLGLFIRRAGRNFTSHWESETTTTATFPTTAGGWIVWGDVLYKALTNITPGDTYVIGGNIEHFTIEDLYNEYLNAIANIVNTIGDLVDLETVDKSNLVAAINEVVGALAQEVADRTEAIAQEVTDRTEAIQAINDKLTSLAILNVKDFGAKGDGTTDDTQAFNECISAATSSGASVFIPAGDYLITDTIQIAFDKAFSMFGVGDASRILHSVNVKLFEFITNRVNLFAVRNLRITSSDTVKSAGSSAFYFANGCYRVLFENVRYDIDNEPDLPNRHFSNSFFVCPADKTSDTVAFNNCYLEHIDGHAIELGQGSSVWVTGGRIVGTWFSDRRAGSVGVYCNGNMGGVYLVSVDFIELFMGLELANNINIPNREFFISNVTFDGDKTGVDINDSSYFRTFIELTGCWICTSESIGIYVHPNNVPILKLNNCYFHNTGAGSATPTNSYAINANGGQISVSNSKFYKNLGYAVYMESSANCLINACEFAENHKNGVVKGKITLHDNIFTDGTIVRSDYNPTFYNNIGYDGVETPTVPDSNSGVINQTGQRVLVVIESVSENPLLVYLNSELQDVKTLVLKPNDIISLGYVDAPKWTWFALS